MPALHEDDEQLMLAYQAGDQDAFQKLYQRYAAKLYGYLRKRLPLAHDEVFQMVFLKLHEKRAAYDREYRFAPWFFTIAHNVLVDYVRRDQRHHGGSEFDEQVHSSDADDGGNQVHQDERRHQLRDALNQLSAEEHRLLQVRFEQELDYEDIARALGLSVPATRKRLSRILAKLRGLLP